MGCTTTIAALNIDVKKRFFTFFNVFFIFPTFSKIKNVENLTWIFPQLLATGSILPTSCSDSCNKCSNYLKYLNFLLLSTLSCLTYYIRPIGISNLSVRWKITNVTFFFQRLQTFFLFLSRFLRFLTFFLFFGERFFHLWLLQQHVRWQCVWYFGIGRWRAVVSARPSVKRSRIWEIGGFLTSEVN